MNVELAAEVAADKFFEHFRSMGAYEFVNAANLAPVPEPEKLFIASEISGWLDCTGFYDIGESYLVLAQMVDIIMDRWIKNPDIFCTDVEHNGQVHRVTRRVVGMFYVEDNGVVWRGSLDPEVFQVELFNFKHHNDH